MNSGRWIKPVTNSGREELEKFRKEMGLASKGP
jgi:hypothetical protein